MPPRRELNQSLQSTNPSIHQSLPPINHIPRYRRGGLLYAKSVIDKITPECPSLPSFPRLRPQRHHNCGSIFLLRTPPPCAILAPIACRHMSVSTTDRNRRITKRQQTSASSSADPSVGNQACASRPTSSVQHGTARWPKSTQLQTSLHSNQAITFLSHPIRVSPNPVLVSPRAIPSAPARCQEPFIFLASSPPNLSAGRFATLFIGFVGHATHYPVPNTTSMLTTV